MFNKNKKEKSSEYEKAEKKAKNREKIRSYDEFYKHPVDKKKIILSVTLVLTIILFVFVAIIAFKFFDKNSTETPVITQEPTISAEELYNQELKKKLSNDYTIGLTTKEDLINNGIINLEASGKNYLIKNSYTNINNIDYLTTFFLKDDILVGILHEAMLDTTTKYKLSTKFQTIVSELNQTYKNIEISERWFGEEMKYDTSLWNNLIINNKLELVAELASGSEFIKVIASGVPYFDYKYNNTFDKSFGNLAIIYSNGANQGLFKQIETIDFNEPNEEESTDVTTEPVVEETQTTEGTEVSQTTEN